MDLSFLKHLPDKEIKNGMVEMIKIIALKDLKSWKVFKKNIYNLLTNSLNAEVTYLIDQSILLMIEELSPNLFEKNLSRIVDYGHEFGHIIETLTNYELSHGEAVGIGMLLSNLISYNKGLMDKNDFIDFLETYQKLNFPLWHSRLSAENLYSKVDAISRHKGGEFSIVALEKISKPIFINSISFSEIILAADFLKGLELGHADACSKMLLIDLIK